MPDARNHPSPGSVRPKGLPVPSEKDDPDELSPQPSEVAVDDDEPRVPV